MGIKKVGKAKITIGGGAWSDSLIYCADEASAIFRDSDLDLKRFKELRNMGTHIVGNKFRSLIPPYEVCEVNLQGILNQLIEEDTHKPRRLSIVKSGGSRGRDLPCLYCAYQGTIYKFDRAGYSDDEMVLQIMDLEDAERKKFERLRNKLHVATQEEGKQKRPGIPEDIRIAVWRRDKGKCCKCGGRENLEYDHIIPISKGGSNTARNIELLCERCNRQKGSHII